MTDLLQNKFNHERENMYKKHTILFLLILLAGLDVGYSSTKFKSSNRQGQTGNRVSAKLSPQIELYAGIGYYNPSLKAWNDAAKDFNAEIFNSGSSNLQAFKQVKDGIVYDIDNSLVNLGPYGMESSGESYLSANMINHFGIKYFFNNKISLSLSIAYFKADANTSYFAESQGVEENWPFFGYSVSDQLTVSQKVESFPTLLTVLYNPSLPFMKDLFDFYVGGGVGFYFSKVETGIARDYMMDHSKGESNWDMVDISSDPVNSDIISNIRANANPFGYHVSAGFNYGFKNLIYNFELGYNFAVAKLDDEDWTFFTRNYTPVKTFEGKNYSTANEAYETIYKETRKYFLEIPETAFDDLKITELDFSGYIIKGGIGFSF